ncbi:MAG: tRNA (adenosine(37)-N6)-dimethylallyltransferase MiaA [Alphaproteobacteria bacterium]|jgi:tRNA dimethylallyltransferase|nr:tRNA (adenosine(37)-N6)-dimethylallyltransferase MiaA [Alphaproteobacteria bacterium]QQS57203.1 MAG: tRNA (adenosine(37)-N6)-dimethylallyltransferase MiaA [Alphaproteobacteria bacterium]
MTQKNEKDGHAIRIIAGPTASGKSARAIEIAQQENGVIINCDSMQIFDGLPILTAQPPPADREKAEHKLYSALHPNDPCSAGEWRRRADPVIRETLTQGKTPIIVGGTGLYIKALTEGLSPIPPVPDDIRAAAVAKQKLLGNPAFHTELEKRDPVMAARFHPSHTARLIRAWEVLDATGKSLAEWQKEDRLAPPDDWNFEIELIIPDRPVQHQRCNDRLLWMIDNGVLEEIEEFAKRVDSGEIRSDTPLLKALGYQQLLAYINGERSKEDAIAQAQAKTRQYAKQQVTWFRHQL